MAQDECPPKKLGPASTSAKESGKVSFVFCVPRTPDADCDEWVIVVPRGMLKNISNVAREHANVGFQLGYEDGHPYVELYLLRDVDEGELLGAHYLDCPYLQAPPS